MTENDIEINLETYSKKEPHEHIIEHSKRLFFIINSLKSLQEKVQRIENENIERYENLLSVNENIRNNITLLNNKLDLILTSSLPITIDHSIEIADIVQRLDTLNLSVDEKHESIVDTLCKLSSIDHKLVHTEIKVISLFEVIKIKLKRILKSLHLMK